jgi:ubiquinone biosynthesis monooxygenase Coq7
MVEKRIIEGMIRVNQAGEYGAKRIYEGQLFILGKDSHIEHMAEQEQVHLHTFNQLAIENHVRPTIFQPLWHVGAFALGAATALLGRKGAHACTVAVETVIDQHYEKQIEKLRHDPNWEGLAKTIETFRQDELAHKEIAQQEGGDSMPILCSLIRKITQGAIWISEKI